MASAADVSAPLKGIVYMLAGGFLVTVQDGIVKSLTADMPAGEILFIRALFSLIPLAWIISTMGGFQALRVRNLAGQSFRAVAFTIDHFLFISALMFLPLADITAIMFAGPLFVTLLAIHFLGEQVGWRRWAAVIVGFVGVLVIIRPTPDAIRWAAFLALGSTFLSAVRDIITRRLRTTETSASILFFTTIASMAGALLSSPFGWRMPTLMEVGMLAIAGTLVGLGHYVQIEALRFAEAALVAPFRYLNMVWAILIGYVVWGDFPDRFTILGSLLVIMSGLYILHRETIRRRTALRDAGR